MSKPMIERAIRYFDRGKADPKYRIYETRRDENGKLQWFKENSFARLCDAQRFLDENRDRLAPNFTNLMNGDPL